MNTVLPYLKALVAFVVPGAVVLGSAVTDASDGGATITTAEWVTALVACIVTSGAVYQAPNRDPRAQHQDESVQPPQRNESGHMTIPGMRPLEPWQVAVIEQYERNRGAE